MKPISQAFRCFDAVARRGSVRQAAEALHLTAAAVHQQIVNFEEQVGTPLFDRLPKGMQLTAAGEIVLAAVRRSQRDFDNALSQVESLRSLRRGHVNLGVPHASAETLMPAVIDDVAARHPGIRWSVRTGHGETLLRWLAGGEVDAVFCLQRVPPPGVTLARTWPQRLGAVMAPGHPLAHGPARLRLRDCVAYPLVLGAPDMELRQMAERMASRARLVLQPQVETHAVAMVRALVAGGERVGLLIQENVAEDVAAGRLVWRPLADAEATSQIGLYQRAGQPPSAAMGVLVEALDARLAALLRRIDDAAGSAASSSYAATHGG